MKQEPPQSIGQTLQLRWTPTPTDYKSQKSIRFILRNYWEIYPPSATPYALPLEPQKRLPVTVGETNLITVRPTPNLV